MKVFRITPRIIVCAALKNNEQCSTCGCVPGHGCPDSERCSCQDTKPDVHFYTIRALRVYLQEHPEIVEITREWWNRTDLIEEQMYTRDEILTAKARVLKQGETIQWAADHGRLS